MVIAGIFSAVSSLLRWESRRRTRKTADICKAIRNADIDIAINLIRNSLPVQRIEKEDDRSILHIAAEENQPRVLCELLCRGADANIRDRKGNSPLHDAARNGSLEALMVLLSADGDKNATNNKGETPEAVIGEFSPEREGIVRKLLN